MVKNLRLRVIGGGVGVWAFLLSLAVHGFLFLVFSRVYVSEGTLETGRNEPAVVSVTQIQKAASLSSVVPKPMVKRVEVGDLGGKKGLDLDAGERRKAEYFGGYTSAVSGKLEGDLLAGQFASGPSTEFFGSSTNLRKICYVVDASGSMQGRVGMVRRQLKKSIANLEADQYFYIIFFRGDGLVESGDGVMVRATAKAKSSANKFIDSVRFEGPTNAANAIGRAMGIKGVGGESAQQIYFLSDGFDLETGESSDFAGMVEKMRKKLAPSVRINTIGIWVEPGDKMILQEIASGTGGEFVGLE